MNSETQPDQSLPPEFVEAARKLGVTSVTLQLTAAAIPPDPSAAAHPPDVPGTPAYDHRVAETFLATPLGKRWAAAFEIYPDPRLRLTRDLLDQLRDTCGMNRGAAFLFRKRLIELGGLTRRVLLDDLMALRRSNSKTPTRMISLGVQAIIEAVATTSYLVPEGTNFRASTLAVVVNEVRAQCQKNGLGDQMPCYNTVKSHIHKLISAQPKKLNGVVLGKKAARDAEPRQGTLDATHFGQWLHIDATVVDCFALPDGGFEFVKVYRKSRKGKSKTASNAGARQEATRRLAFRGRLTLIIDATTTMVCAVGLNPESVSAHETLRTVERMMGDQSDVLRALGVENLPPPMGAPLYFVTDHGREFTNRSVLRVCSRYGIGEAKRTAGTVHLGGAVERVIGTVNNYTHSLGSSATSSVVQRRGFDAQAHAQVEFHELYRYLTRLIFDRYNMMCAPLCRLNRRDHAQALIDEGKSLFRPLSEEELVILHQDLMPVQTCTLSKKGVRLNNRFYGGRGLDDLIRRIPHGKVNIDVVYDPTDIRTALGYADGQGEAIPLTCTRLPADLQDAGPVSEDEFQIAYKLIRDSHRLHRDQALTEIDAFNEVMRRRVTEQATPRNPKRREKTAPPTLRPEQSTLFALTMGPGDDEDIDLTPIIDPPGMHHRS